MEIEELYQKFQLIKKQPYGLFHVKDILFHISYLKHHCANGSKKAAAELEECQSMLNFIGDKKDGFVIVDGCYEDNIEHAHWRNKLPVFYGANNDEADLALSFYNTMAFIGDISMKVYRVENRLNGAEHISTVSGYQEAYVIARNKGEAMTEVITISGWKEFGLKAVEVNLLNCSKPMYLAANLEE